jgi:hypothetical protein
LSGLNRRTFVQLSAGAMLTSASRSLLGEAPPPAISEADGLLRIRGETYTWEYREPDDTFRLLDSSNRLIVSGSLQPAVVVLRQSTLHSGSVRQARHAAHTSSRAE